MYLPDDIDIYAIIFVCMMLFGIPGLIAGGFLGGFVNWKIFIKYYNTTKKEFAFIVSIATIVIGLSVFIIYFILGRVEYRAGALLIAVFAGYVTGVIGFATQFWLFTPKNTAASMREHIVVGMILSLIQLTSIIIGTFAITFIATRF